VVFWLLLISMIIFSLVVKDIFSAPSQGDHLR
jgi:hypothetical protein